MMLWVSVGIMALTIGTLIVAQKQTEHQIAEAYSEGFRAGADVVIRKKYEALEALEKENGLTSVAADSAR